MDTFRMKNHLTLFSHLVFVFVTGNILLGCPKKTDDEDIPSPQPPSATVAPIPVTSVVPEEPTAGVGGAPAQVSTAKPVGGGDATGIRKCCSALRQNANSVPLDQKAAYIGAASICDGLVSSPQGRQTLSQVRVALKGMSVPSSCQ